MTHAAAMMQGPRGLVMASALGLALMAAGFVTIQGIAGFGGWLRFGAGPGGVEAVLADIYEAQPQLVHVEDHAPDVHARLLAIVTRDVELDLPRAQSIANARTLFDTWRADALPGAPDRVLQAYLALATDRLRELEHSNPALCAAMTLGRPAEDSTPWLSAQHMQREMYVDLMLLRASPGERTSAMTRAEIQSIRHEIEIALHVAFAGAANLLYVQRPIAPDEEATICQLGIATMQAVAGLGPERTPAAVRGMFFGP